MKTHNYIFMVIFSAMGIVDIAGIVIGETHHVFGLFVAIFIVWALWDDNKKEAAK